MSLSRIRIATVTAGIALAACTTTYTEAELAEDLPADAKEEASSEKSALEYDKGVEEIGGENAQALDEEAEWNWESANE
jgi:hypothetical protein